MSFWYIAWSLILITLMQFLLTLTKGCSVITIGVRIRGRFLVGFWKERRSCPLACLTSMFQGHYLSSFVSGRYKSCWSELTSSIVDKSCWWWGRSIKLITKMLISVSYRNWISWMLLVLRDNTLCGHLAWIYFFGHLAFWVWAHLEILLVIDRCLRSLISLWTRSERR